MSQLSLKQLQKSFNEAHIIKGIDLEVSEGEFVVFVGPSGCGKSTLLRMIAGLEEISGGDLESAACGPMTCRRKSATSRWCFNPMRCFRT